MKLSGSRNNRGLYGLIPVSKNIRYYQSREQKKQQNHSGGQFKKRDHREVKPNAMRIQMAEEIEGSRLVPFDKNEAVDIQPHGKQGPLQRRMVTHNSNQARQQIDWTRVVSHRNFLIPGCRKRVGSVKYPQVKDVNDQAG